MGCRVVLACRNLDSAALARSKILKEVPEAEIELAQMDVSALASVRAFVKGASACF